ncbi:MAG: hypothetical protein K2N35_10685 [Muribaculaceae bacterium]|nr:hypothetical protein [Muribaculaceae bacterium]
MATLNILIVWGIIVVAMTVVISVRLFHRESDQVRSQKVLSKRDKVMKNVKY